MIQLPAFFFPTTILVLDDDKHFSRLLKLSLANSFRVQEFHKPQALLNYLEEEIVGANLSTLCNPDKVKSHIACGLSEKTVSVIVTDYQLDHTNGLEILSKIKSRSIQKALMSNFVRNEVVHKAFRERKIQAFLPKLDRNFITKLKNTIMELERQFFIDYCVHHYQIPLVNSKLCDSGFAKYLNKIIAKFDITHMVSNNDLTIFELESELKKNKVSLHVALEEDFTELVHSLQAENAPSSILKKIEERLVIPCFPNGNIQDGSLWGEHLKPIIPIHGEQSYYISCFSKNEGIPFDSM